MPLWTPAQLGSTVLRGWFKADAITGVADAADLSQWNDSSGNAAHASSATRPVYRLNRLNGLPGVDFDPAGTDRLDTTVPGNSLAETILAVVDLDTASTRTIVGAVSAGQRQFRTTAANKLEYVKSGTAIIGTSTSGISLNTPTIVHGTLGTTTWDFSINGGTLESGAHAQTMGGAVGSILGFCVTGGSDYWDGELFEVVICSTLVAADRQKVEGYLAYKWGLQAGLPGGHPYKTTPLGVPAISVAGVF